MEGIDITYVLLISVDVLPPSPYVADVTAPTGYFKRTLAIQKFLARFRDNLYMILNSGHRFKSLFYSTTDNTVHARK